LKRRPSDRFAVLDQFYIKNEDGEMEPGAGLSSAEGLVLRDAVVARPKTPTPEGRSLRELPGNEKTTKKVKKKRKAVVKEEEEEEEESAEEESVEEEELWEEDVGEASASATIFALSGRGFEYEKAPAAPLLNADYTPWLETIAMWGFQRQAAPEEAIKKETVVLTMEEAPVEKAPEVKAERVCPLLHLAAGRTPVLRGPKTLGGQPLEAF